MLLAEKEREREGRRVCTRKNSLVEARCLFLGCFKGPVLCTTSCMEDKREERHPHALSLHAFIQTRVIVFRIRHR